MNQKNCSGNGGEISISGAGTGSYPLLLPFHLPTSPMTLANDLASVFPIYQDDTVVKSMNLEPYFLGLNHLLAGWLWPGYSTSLCLSFLICEMVIILGYLPYKVVIRVQRGNPRKGLRTHDKCCGIPLVYFFFKVRFIKSDLFNLHPLKNALSLMSSLMSLMSSSIYLWSCNHRNQDIEHLHHPLKVPLCFFLCLRLQVSHSHWSDFCLCIFTFSQIS